MKHKHPEKIIQSRIHSALRALGYISFPIPNRGLYNPITHRYNIQNDPWQIPGIPDVVVILPEARVLWVEVKSEAGIQSPHQIHMADALQERGHHYLLARSVKDVLEWLKTHGYKSGEVA